MTMHLFKPALLGLAMTLSACGGTPDLYSVQPPAVTETLRISFGSVQVNDVSLPSYAAANEIAIEDETGKLLTKTNTLWADTPERAVALELAGHLARMSGARVASEPWPLEEFPEARLDVRFERLIAGVDGQFRAAGQYFVAVREGGRRERAETFDLSVPYDPEGGPQAIARARGQLILDLAREIARTGLR